MQEEINNLRKTFEAFNKQADALIKKYPEIQEVRVMRRRFHSSNKHHTTKFEVTLE